MAEIVLICIDTNSEKPIRYKEKFSVFGFKACGGDEESRTPVRKCRPMNFSERRPCFIVSNSCRTRTNYAVPACEFPAAAARPMPQGIPLSDVCKLPAGLAARDVSCD